nr:DUF2782 domain-containing protein [Luteimonas aquatica]
MALVLSASLALTACATLGGDAAADADIPPDAVATTVTHDNGDVVTEYRVAGRMRAIKVVPSRGPAYYLYDRNGDGIVDEPGGNPPQTYFKLFEWK